MWRQSFWVEGGGGDVDRLLYDRTSQQEIKLSVELTEQYYEIHLISQH